MLLHSIFVQPLLVHASAEGQNREYEMLRGDSSFSKVGQPIYVLTGVLALGPVNGAGTVVAIKIMLSTTSRRRHLRRPGIYCEASSRIW